MAGRIVADGSWKEIDPLTLLTPRRRPEGLSAVLLPFTSQGEVDWAGFERLLERTVNAGLAPAVNMDTGYANLIDDATRREALERTQQAVGSGRFVAGAFVTDTEGAPFNAAGYTSQIEAVVSRGGVPVIFQSHGLTAGSDAEVLDRYGWLGEQCHEFIAFELGPVFAPFGKIYSLDLYRQLMGVAACTGAKHSSLRREPEWARLQLRNAHRPDFHVYTGNDLAIDMVIYGSDYLLGLSALAPDAFARRDALWAAGDSRWNGLNDLLQHLGFLAFGDPVPAYKHSVATFLKARGWIDSAEPHPRAPRRDDANREVIAKAVHSLDALMEETADCTPAEDVP